MKIVKFPFETKIKCDCGCEFEFEYDDININETETYGLQGILHTKELYVECPFCKKIHFLNEQTNLREDE